MRTSKILTLGMTLCLALAIPVLAGERGHRGGPANPFGPPAHVGPGNGGDPAQPGTPGTPLPALPDGLGSLLGLDGPFATATLMPTPLAGNAGLEDTWGLSFVQVDRGVVFIVVVLGDAELPAGSVLEGWVVDPGLEGGPGGVDANSVSDADEVYGTPFGNATFDMRVDNAPYALSTGVLKPLGNHILIGRFEIDNNLSPYDEVVITLEADGNGENYDPRPGTPVLAGGF